MLNLDTTDPTYRVNTSSTTHLPCNQPSTYNQPCQQTFHQQSTHHDTSTQGIINPAAQRPSFAFWCQQHAPSTPNSHRILLHRKKEIFRLLLSTWYSTSTHCKPTTASITNRIHLDPPTYDDVHGCACEYNSIYLPVTHTTYVIPAAKLLRRTSMLRRHHVRFRMLPAALLSYRNTTVHDHAGTTTHHHHICTTRHLPHTHTVPVQTMAAFWTMMSLWQPPGDQTQYHTHQRFFTTALSMTPNRVGQGFCADEI